MNYGKKHENNGSLIILQTIKDNGTVSWEAVISRKKPYKLTTTSPELATRLDDTTYLISTLSVESIIEKKAVKVSPNILTKNQVYDVTIIKS